MRAFSVGTQIVHAVGLPLSTRNCVPHVHFARSPTGLTVFALGHRRSYLRLCVTGPHSARYGGVLHSGISGCVGRGIFHGLTFCNGQFILADRHSKCGHLCFCSLGKALIGGMARNGLVIGAFCNCGTTRNTFCCTTGAASRPVQASVCHASDGKGAMGLSQRTNARDTVFDGGVGCCVGICSDVHAPCIASLYGGGNGALGILRSGQRLGDGLGTLRLNAHRFFGFAARRNIRLGNCVIGPTSFGPNGGCPIIVFRCDNPDSRRIVSS